MELRTVNPRKLKFNPTNPRRTKAMPEQDAQLTANILAHGLIQPPIVRQDGDDLVIVAGERRVRCSIKARLAEIPVLVRGADDGADAMRSLAENVVRAEMCSVDLWRHIEAMLGSDQGWNEQGVATALNMNIRSVKRLRLLARIHPAILDHMAQGDEPDPDDLQLIANAPLDEQEAVWKAHKPKKGTEASWWSIVNPLRKRRLLRKHARFDDEMARRFGIAWEDDLFGPGGEDNLYTTKVEEFFAAQTEWLAASLPDLHPRASILTTAAYGGAELPAGAQRAYGQPEEGDEVGFYLDRNTGAVESIPFRTPVRSRATREADGSGLPRTAGTRPDVTQKGVAMIGDYRTDALHQALRENEIDDQTLIGLLVLALGGRNVTVQSPVQRATFRQMDGRGQVAGQVIEGGVLTGDPGTVRTAARAMLGQVLSCRDGMTDSGAVARVAGDAIGADRFLPNMATEDFLKCLSKGAMERAASAERVLPRQTGKATRAALIEHVGQGTYILPAARFALTRTELERLEAKTADRAAYGSAEEDESEGIPDGDEGEDPTDDADEAGAPGEEGEDDLTANLPPPNNDAGLTQAAA
ncbi:ParB N-terminal domain-containing protein [Roseomonas mucosa]|uniref:ParB N-terminal domain-containing protein n=1 Tax=Roseomonas mucosa TaxID=207340 RepID=UPI001EF4B295|nr:ParB N-terminal domain-containing protein [Roseomonas mucosa]MCG7359529.1 ParB N-terminal domain-containing protein [Roseomonas mucosa]